MMDLATIAISAAAIFVMFSLSYGVYQVLSIDTE
jgi:hypothetical protein